MKNLVIIPIYNEEENIKKLVAKIILLNSQIDILLVDDNSIDNSLDIINRCKNKYSGVFVITNDKHHGRGFVIKQGYLFAINRGYNYIIEMDADFSHRPEDIPLLLHIKKKSNIVIGSRLITGAKIERSSELRNLITRLGNIYLKFVLNLNNINDVTSGFRCIEVAWLKNIDMTKLWSNGFQSLQEIIYKNKDNISMEEVPIIFKERYKGQSKLNIDDILKSVYLPLYWRIKDFLIK